MRKIWKKLKNYPELLGIGAVCILVGIIFLYKLEVRREYVDPGIATEDMARESTVDGFKEPEESVRYMISALQKEDLDMGLRGFPIDEKILGINVGEALDFLGEFSTNITYMPSEWREFVPVSSSEITKDYTEIFRSLESQFAGKNVTVEAVRALMPQKQMGTQYHRNSQQICQIWGADSRIEALAKLTVDGADYALPVTLFRYDDFWKTDSFEASLLEESGIFSCDSEEYDELTDEKEEEALKEFLEDSDKEKSQEQTEEEEEEILPEEALLPANYVLYNTVFSQTPEKAIENFILSMQKNDLSSMMIYTDLYGEEDPLSQDLTEILIRQGEVAEQIQTFYYYLMGNEFAATENVSLDELGMTGEEISSSLELSEIVYLDLNNVLKIKDDEYAAFYYFNGKHYMSGFNMKEYGQGWKIEELSCASMGLDKGQVKELTETEYNKIIKEYS